MKSENLSVQFHNNAVALISLIIAIIALGYNTWREERTERNRNLRVAAFEILKNLGELQGVINYSYYLPETAKSDPLVGWGHVSLIGDLAQLLPNPVPQKIEQLILHWREDWKSLSHDEVAVDRLTQDIDESRKVVLDTIRYQVK